MKILFLDIILVYRPVEFIEGGCCRVNIFRSSLLLFVFAAVVCNFKQI